jgi:hypothetical protein
MIEHFYPFEVAIPLQKLHQRLEIHMEKASGIKEDKRCMVCRYIQVGRNI